MKRHAVVEMGILFVTVLRSRLLGPSDHSTCKHVDDNTTRTMLHVLQRACTATTGLQGYGHNNQSSTASCGDWIHNRHERNKCCPRAHETIVTTRISRTGISIGEGTKILLRIACRCADQSRTLGRKSVCCLVHRCEHCLVQQGRALVCLGQHHVVTPPRVRHPYNWNLSSADERSRIRRQRPEPLPPQHEKPRKPSRPSRPPPAKTPRTATFCSSMPDVG